MSLHLNDVRNRSQFVTQHHVRTRTSDDLEFYVLTGVVVLHWKSEAGRDWRREPDLTLGVTVPGIPSGKALQLRQWAPLITLNAISNDHSSNWPGWALDSFHIPRPRDPITQLVVVQCQVAGWDPDGWVLRLGYHITLTGEFVDAPPGPF